MSLQPTDLPPVTKAGTYYTPTMIYQLARKHGANSGQAVVATAVALAESGGYTNAVNVVGGTGPARGSRDRGLWQINSYWHKEVSDADAFDPDKAAQHTARISGGWRNWDQWTTYTSGSYKKHLDTAVKAGGKEVPEVVVKAGNNPPAIVSALAGLGEAAGLEGVATGLATQAATGGGLFGFLASLTNPLEVLAAIAKALVNPEFWRRVGIGLLGIGLVYVGIYLFSDDLSLDDIATAAGAVASKGATAKGNAA